MITREQLIKRAEQRARIEEIKASPFASTPEGQAFIKKAEESVVIKPEAPPAVEEPKQAVAKRPKAPAPVKKKEESIQVPELDSLATQSIDKHNIPENVVSEMFKTDQMLGIKPGSTMAQLFVESGFNPRAVSKVGAKGLAQVMPNTLRSIQERVGRKLNPFNLIDAVIIHREVMKENLKRFKDWSAALMAYNAGWNRSRWGKTKESAEYIQRVEGAMSRLFKSPQKLADISVKNKKPM